MHDLEQIFNNLRSFEILEDLNDSELQQIVPFFAERSFHKGDIIVKQNDLHFGCCFIIYGKVKVYNRIFGKQKSILSTLTKNSTFGEVSMLDGSVAAVNVDAIEDTLVYSLSDTHFQEIKMIFPEIAIIIAKKMAKQICAKVRHAVKKDISTYLSEFGSVHLNTTNTQFSHDLEANIESNMHLIRDFTLYKQLVHDEFIELLKYSNWMKVPKGQIIYKQGDKYSGKTYLIVNGAVEAMLTQGKTKAKLQVFGPGNIFGHLEFVDLGNRYSTTFAREDLLLLTFSLDQINELKEKDSILYNKFLEFIISRLGLLLRSTNKLLMRVLAIQKY